MTRQFDMEQSITLAPTAFGTPVDNEMMVMDIEEGHYLVLDDIASAIWAMLEEAPGGLAGHEIVDRLEQAYDALEGQVANDVSLFLANLKARNLIVTA